MNKSKLGVFMALILSMGIISAGLVSAEGSEITQVKVLDLGKEIRLPNQANSLANEENRMIVKTTSEIDKLVFRLKGCKLLHELNDATAIECPKGVAIKGARPDRIFHMHDLEADIQINADDVWNMIPKGYDGRGVKVAILDTGVDTIHIELKDSLRGKKATKNFLAPYYDNFDRSGHGTHVSGIITANGVYKIGNNYATGVAPGANIIVGKVCNGNGVCYESAIMAGIEWAVAQKADILSMSLGSPYWHTMNENCDIDGGLIVDKVNWATSQGVTTVISAGNEGETANGISSPACASGAIAVGAVDKSDNIAAFSNHGPALDLVAPGVGILSTYSCVAAGDCGFYWYAGMSGTSMSAPHVAGTAALILQKNPNYRVDEVKEALYSTALDLGTGGYDHYYGHGRVDAYAAINYEPPTCNDYCINLEGLDYSSGDCKNKCNTRKGEVLEEGFTCSNNREVCCCN